MPFVGLTVVQSSLPFLLFMKGICLALTSSVKLSIKELKVFGPPVLGLLEDVVRNESWHYFL